MISLSHVYRELRYVLASVAVFGRKPKQWANSSIFILIETRGTIASHTKFASSGTLYKRTTTQRIHLLPIDDEDSYSKPSFLSKDKEMERIDHTQHIMKLR